MALLRIPPPAPALMGIKPRTGLVCNWEPGREARLYAVKSRIHHRLLERLDFAQLETLEQAKMAQEIRQVLSQLLEDEPEPLNLAEKARLVEELEFEILGLGPLEPLLKDPPSRTSWSTGMIRYTSKGAGGWSSPRCGSKTMNIY